MKAMREGTPLSDEDLKAVPAKYREAIKARMKKGGATTESRGRGKSRRGAGGGEGGGGS